MILLALACAPKVDRGPTLLERAADAPAWVELGGDGPNVYYQAVIRAGSGYDPDDQHGLAALTAHAMVEAGAGENTAQQIREALFPTANAFEVVVGRDLVSLRLRCHRDHAVLCAGLFADALVRPTFRPADVDRLRDQAQRAVTDDLAASEEALGEEVFHAAIYEAHPYGHPVQGRAGTLALLDADDLAAFHRRHYLRATVTFGTAGAVPDEARALLQQAQQALPVAAAPELLLPLPHQPEGRELVVIDTDNAVTGFHLGHPLEVDRNHEDWAALKVALAAFGRHRHSGGRLFRTLRTARGLNYGTYAYSEPFTQRGWSKLPENARTQQQQHFFLWIRPTSVENGPFALKLALAELTELVEHGLTQDELDTWKQHLSRFAPLEAVDPGRRLAYALDAAVTSTPNPIELVPRLVPDLTLEQVNDAIRRHLHPDDLVIVAVTGEGEKLAEALGEGMVTPIVYADVEPGPAQAEQDDTVSRTDLDIRTVHHQPAEGLFR